MSRLARCGVLIVGLFVSVAQAQPPAPTPSGYTLDLTEFATHSGARAIDVVSPIDNTGRVFVSAQSGEIFAYDSSGSSLGTFVDLKQTTATTGFVDLPASFRGLMYFDFHPDFNNPSAAGYRKVYTGFQVDSATGGATAEYSRPHGSPNYYTIGEWEVDASNANRIDTSTYREVITFGMEGPNPHGLGEVAFNPLATPADDDYGLLYAAIGDANSRGNNNPVAGYIQNLDNPFGKIIRIDPLQNGADPYSVPTSNPFDDGGPLLDNDGVAEEIYALGFRDPQSFSFAEDNSGETVLVTFDIGASNREEVDLVRAGENYGWDRFEGTSDLNPSRPLVPGTSHSLPVLEYDHATGGFAIIGGVLVSDPFDPNFQNQVIFSDLVNGKMFHADFDAMLAAEQGGTQATIFEMDVMFDGNTGRFSDVLDGVVGGRGDARFGVDGFGRLFIVSKQTDKIFATGLVTDFEAPTGVAGDVNQDGLLTSADIDDFVAGWLSDTSNLAPVQRIELGDLDLDGMTDLVDALLLHNAFASAGLGGLDLSRLTSVPEPSALVLMGLGMLACFGGRTGPLAERRNTTVENTSS